jgi:hypothetical protein
MCINTLHKGDSDDDDDDDNNNHNTYTWNITHNTESTAK